MERGDLSRRISVPSSFVAPSPWMRPNSPSSISASSDPTTAKLSPYLNEKEVAHLSGKAATPFMRLTFPVSTLLSNSVVAVEVRRAVTAQESAPIVFDVVVSAASSGPIGSSR